MYTFLSSLTNKIQFYFTNIVYYLQFNVILKINLYLYRILNYIMNKYINFSNMKSHYGRFKIIVSLSIIDSFKN